MEMLIGQVTCLHVPKLVGGTTAEICWKAVDNAMEYEIEVCFDTSFGGTDATGKSWSSIKSSGKTWSQTDISDMRWQDIEELTESHTVYKGAGTAVSDPDAGLTWAHLKVLNKTWAALAEKSLSWAEIILLYVPGLTWNSLDAKYLSFDQGHRCWEELEENEPYTMPHLSCYVNIPLNVQQAVFRIYARDTAGNALSALYTSQIPVIASQKMGISPLNGPQIVEIESKQVCRATATRYKLSYYKSLVDITPSHSKLQPDLGLADKLWNGLAADLQVRTKTKKAATLQLDWHKAK